MAPPPGNETGTQDVPGLAADPRFDPYTPLSLKLAPARGAKAAEPPPALADVPALILALLGRTEPSLTPIEQRVLRACLRLAGEQLPLVGGLDADFYEALLAFKARHGVLQQDSRLDLPTFTLIVQHAAIRVGGVGRLRRLRAAAFDVLVAPDVLDEAPGVANLIRELKGGHTRLPQMAPPTHLPPLPDEPDPAESAFYGG